MERIAAYGHGFPAGGAMDPRYGPGVRYGEPQRSYGARNVYVRNTYNPRHAYDAQYMSGYYPPSAPFAETTPASTDSPGNFGYQQRGYEAPYYEPYPHMTRNHRPNSQNSPPVPEIEEPESVSEIGHNKSIKQQGLLTAGSAVSVPMLQDADKDINVSEIPENRDKDGQPRRQRETDRRHQLSEPRSSAARRQGQAATNDNTQTPETESHANTYENSRDNKTSKRFRSQKPTGRSSSGAGVSGRDSPPRGTKTGAEYKVKDQKKRVTGKRTSVPTPASDFDPYSPGPSSSENDEDDGYDDLARGQRKRYSGATGYESPNMTPRDWGRKEKSEKTERGRRLASTYGGDRRGGRSKSGTRISGSEREASERVERRGKSTSRGSRDKMGYQLGALRDRSRARRGDTEEKDFGGEGRKATSKYPRPKGGIYDEDAELRRNEKLNQERADERERLAMEQRLINRLDGQNRSGPSWCSGNQYR